MTEREWLACRDPDALLSFLGVRASARRLRLFACACCRSIWRLVQPESFRRLVELSEQYAEGVVDRQALLEAIEPVSEMAYGFHSAVSQAVWATAWSKSFVQAAEFAARAAGAAAAAQTVRGETDAHTAWLRARVAEESAYAEERARQCLLLRDIFAPFTRVSIDPAWRVANNGAVRQLAVRIRDNRRFDELPVLGQALKHAGCAEERILRHCAEPAPHGLGCWALDAVLGKD